MIELVNTTPVTVPVGQSIPFSAVATKGGCAERHRAGSAQITLVKPGRYLITFSGNVAVPTGETVGEVALAALEEHMDALTEELGDLSKDADCREERETISRYIEKLRKMM